MNTGKISEAVLQRSVLKYVRMNQKAALKTGQLQKQTKAGADCALFAFTDGPAVAVAAGTAAGSYPG
ncbi:MAG: hypothetical protein LUH19_04650, partial [Lachnospiraceae bacterium]|nr:hypothetical protein [Lachnospiraceae bacterium]